VFKIVDLKLNAVLQAGSEQALPFLIRITEKAKESHNSFDTMTKLMNGAFQSIQKVALGAIAGFTGLAFTSPTVRAELAQMKPTLFDISETLGSSLEPGLKNFRTILKDVSSWIKENTWFTEGLSGAFTTLSEVAGIAWEKMTALADLVVKPVVEWAMNINLGEKLQWLVDNFGYTILGSLLGLKFGLPGMIIGGGLGLAGDLMSYANKSLTEQGIDTSPEGLAAYIREAGMTNQGGAGGGRPIIVNINGTQITPDNVEVIG